jgi:hypothetical protein
MKAYFSGARFKRLLIAQWTENWRSYAWFFGIMTMANLIFLGSAFSRQTFHYQMFEFAEQVIWYSTGLFISGIIFAALHFKHLATPGSALIALMRPASHFEKWLLAFLTVGLLYPLTYTSWYIVLHFPAVQMAKILYVAPELCKTCTKHSLPNFSFYLPFIGIESSNTSIIKPVLRTEILNLIYLWTLQALVLGGTVFFKVSPVLRSVLTYFFLFVSIALTGIAPHEGVFWAGPDSEVIPASPMEYGLSLALWIVLPVLLWLTLFFHIKEREIS